MVHCVPTHSSSLKCWFFRFYSWFIPYLRNVFNSNSLDLNPTGSHVLVGQVGGCARLVGLRQPDNKGFVEQSYSCQETEARPNGGFGAVFATQGQAVLFGSVEGCVLVWDRKKGAIVYALEHDEGERCSTYWNFVIDKSSEQMT
jgi:hypothetical protein